MKQTINEYDFRRPFEQSRPDNFSHEGLGILFEYFEEYEEGAGEEIEFDYIAICCEYSESTIDEVAENYSVDVSNLDEDEKQDAVIDYLTENTSFVGLVSDAKGWVNGEYVPLESTVIYADF